MRSVTPRHAAFALLRKGEMMVGSFEYLYRQLSRATVAVLFATLGFFGLMLVFGLRFDEDVKLPWAKRILTDPALTPAERMDRLWATAMHFLRHRSRNTATPNEVRRG